MKTKTAKQVRADFLRRGVAVSEWAAAHGFSPSQVFNVLSGRNKGRRGKAHDIACALRIKNGVPRHQGVAGRHNG